MAKLTRYLQKIFANNSNQVGVFGTGTDKETSKNVETLQSADYENGWSSAIITNKNYPIWQERDGVDYGLSYQIKYLDQAGIPEWLSTETYYENCYCRYGNDIYYSLQDDNTNHNPALNDGWWIIIDKKFLNKQQITNCLLEVPQRIDYTLVNGEFTLKAGSVVIIPYGTTDLSSTFTVGSTFFNENLKVYDREFVDGKFIVWAQLQNDVVRAASAGGTTAIKTAALIFTSSAISITNAGNAESVASDASASSTSLFYNTTENLVKTKSSGTVSNYTGSLPILKSITDATYNFSEVKQVFNGLGYIGSIVWADKGIKGLIPNGFNADGTLNNEPFTTEQLIIQSIPSPITEGAYRFIGLNATSIATTQPETTFYDASRNILNYNGIRSARVIAGYFIAGANNNVSSMSINEALNFNALCDGQWVRSDLVLANGVTIPTSTDIEYDLSTYLPNDGCDYEVFISGTVTTTSTSGSTLNLLVTSDFVFSRGYICGTQTRTSSTVTASGNAIIPVGASRKIKVSAYSGYTGTFRLFASAYRRCGRNA